MDPARATKFHTRGQTFAPETRATASSQSVYHASKNQTTTGLQKRLACWLFLSIQAASISLEWLFFDQSALEAPSNKGK